MRSILARSAVTALMLTAATGAVAAPQACPGNSDALGTGRTVEIDTTGGPGFGFDHYKVHDFLQPKEVVLTFDDGPQVNTTRAILDALQYHCTKATFFSIGKMALGLPEIIRDVASRGHTVGTHTWSHANVKQKKTDEEMKEEIEKGVSAIRRAVGGPIAPFFRFPTLQDSPGMLKHLAERNIAIFSTDIDSFDFKFRSGEGLVKTVIEKLEKRGKGILLLHDIQPGTAKAVPKLLAELKAKGFKIVHLRPKTELATLPEFDKLIEKDVKGLPAAGTEKPTSSVVKTIEENGVAVPDSAPSATAPSPPPPAPSAAPPAQSPQPSPSTGTAQAAEPSKTLLQKWFEKK